jgi:hypothetical protein
MQFSLTIKVSIYRTKKEGKMKKLSLFAWLSILSIVIAAMSATPILADTISYNATISSQLSDWSNVPLNFTDFNPSLGTLTGVTIDLTATIDTYFTLHGVAGNNAMVTLPIYSDYPGTTNNLPFSLTVTDSNNRISGGPQITTVLNPVASLGGDFTYKFTTSGIGPYVRWRGIIGSSSSVSTPTLTTTAYSKSSYTDSALLSELTGSGVTPLFVATSTFTSGSFYGGGTPGSGGGQTTHAGLVGTITYNYTPVPITGAILLFTPGLAGLAVMRRRFKN